MAESRSAYRPLPPKQLAQAIAELEQKMYQHAKDLEFEQAASLRDEISQLRDQLLVG